MAHGWLDTLGAERVEVRSAGTNPKGVHPIAIRVMSEVGIDISCHTSDHVNRYLQNDFDLVLTVCDAARESCPVFPGTKRTLHRSFEDPDHPESSEAQLTEGFRHVRDEIETYCRELLSEVLE